MFVPVAVDHLCAVQRGQIHAVPAGDVPLRGRRQRRTYDTVCGLHRSRLLAVNAVCVAPVGERQAVESRGVMVMTWPPPARFEDWTRCGDCWEATGRNRPHPGFRELRRAQDESQEAARG